MFSIHYGALQSQVFLCIFLLILIIVRHKENIIRIILGEENKM
jgi:glycerol-3-phosphate acyltransferase PlsY